MAATRTARDIFLATVDRPPAARAAYLDEACGGDAALRQWVEALLRAHDEPGEFLSEAKPGVAGDATGTFGGAAPGDAGPTADFPGAGGRAAAEPTACYPGRDEKVGAVLAGKYKLVEEIGEGGMGSVYMAQQTEPVRRAVTVKVIKAGMDSRAVLARFEAERQALAMMDHPNIARVLDAGTTDGGRPFFVMELVKGTPITQFCDGRRLTPRQRLELFVPVCLAIQHAHQKGVIHRDIKPNNVLVALYDDRPVPKVIDFGVSKAAGQSLTDRTLMTGFGAVVGTPEYMSPEQATLNNLDVDTRSDVYALGVLLYELLTGSTPIDRKSLGRAALLEVLRVVREAEPPRPSARLSSSDALPTIAANRGTEPAKLSRLVKGELDWVVMKALEKDRSRRYETANSLGRDIQRYLADEVIEARAPSTGHRLRKFIRRNRGRVVAVGLVFLALVVGIIGTTWGLLLADRARRDEAGLRDTAQRLQAEAEEGRKKAERQVLSSAVDLDLEYCRLYDKASGILRLARRLKTLPADATDLRQFVTLSLFTWAQELAPLVPDRPPGTAIGLGPDGRWVFYRLHDGSWEWRDLPSGRRFALAGNDVAFEPPTVSEDGRSAVVSVGKEVRVWDLTRHEVRAVIRPDAGNGYRTFLDPTGSRLVTLSYLDPRQLGGSPESRMLARLWDAVTGRVIAQLEHPGDLVGGWSYGSPAHFCRFSPDGRTLLTVGGGNVARVWSTADGRLLHTLRGHDSRVEFAAFSPSGRRAITGDRDRIVWWDAVEWRRDGAPCELAASRWPFARNHFLHDDAVALVFDRWDYRGEPQEIENLCVHGAGAARRLRAVASDGEIVLTADNHVYSLRPFRRVEDLGGRTYPVGLRTLARDGRFLILQDPVRLLDLATDKQVGSGFKTLRHCPSPGWGFAGLTGQYPVALPNPDLVFDDDTLRLWAEVLVRGELDPANGFFVPNDETTWEAKRRELLRRPKPAGRFPFPGVFADDPLYWVRKEFDGEARAREREALIDRLVAAEPTAAHYSTRAQFHRTITHRNDLYLRDTMTAESIEAESPGHTRRRDPPSPFVSGPAEEIIYTPGLPREHYEVAQKWYASWPGREMVRERGVVLYRLGQYREAAELLTRSEQVTAARTATARLTVPLAAALTAALPERSLRDRDWDDCEIETMTIGLCLLRLGRHEEARARLAQARADRRSRVLKVEWHRVNRNETEYLRQVEAEIEEKR
jgi:serine/threonine protein kinase/WD40 repeat protein